MLFSVISGFRAAALPAGVWVQMPYSLIKPADVTAISSEWWKKTTLLANALVSCDTYSDIMKLSVTLLMYAIDESTGIVYEPSVIPILPWLRRQRLSPEWL
jgi:hypothetical protein